MSSQNRYVADIEAVASGFWVVPMRDAETLTLPRLPLQVASGAHGDGASDHEGAIAGCHKRPCSAEEEGGCFEHAVQANS